MYRGRGRRPATPTPAPAAGVSMTTYTQQVSEQAQRVATLGNWPEYIDVQTSLAGRVPPPTPADALEPLTGPGFDAGIACTMDMIPRQSQQLAATLHAAYTPAAVAQIRRESATMDPDSDTCWWLAACAVCREGQVTEDDFRQQLGEFQTLVDNPRLRQAAARRELQEMTGRFSLVDGMPLAHEDGGMQGAYIAGFNISAARIPSDKEDVPDMFFVGTFQETLGLEDYQEWKEPDGFNGYARGRSGPVHGSRQFIKCTDEQEYQQVVAAIRRSADGQQLFAGLA